MAWTMIKTTAAPGLIKELKEISEVSNKMVVDLKTVEYIDNSAVKSLIEFHNMLKNQDGYIYLCNAQYKVAEMLELSKASSKLNIFQNLEEINTFIDF